jgi:hypothetical protein
MATKDSYTEISDIQNQTSLNTIIGSDLKEAEYLLTEMKKINDVTNNIESSKSTDTTIDQDVIKSVTDLFGKVKDLIEETKLQINNYNSSVIYLNKMKELEQKYHVEKLNIDDSIDGIVSTIQTNNRRVDYQTPEVNRLNMVRLLLLIVFYVILIFYVLKNNFIQQVMKRNYRFVAFIIICIFFPFSVDTIIAYIFLFVHYISRFFRNSVPRDVYINV